MVVATWCILSEFFRKYLAYTVSRVAKYNLFVKILYTIIPGWLLCISYSFQLDSLVLLFVHFDSFIYSGKTVVYYCIVILLFSLARPLYISYHIISLYFTAWPPSFHFFDQTIPIYLSQNLYLLFQLLINILTQPKVNYW